jgi:iron(III) transport system ATP-binding protein
MLNVQINKYQVNGHFTLSNIKFKVLNGEILALIGKSGSGKSTIASFLVGLHSAETVSVKLNNKELHDGIERLIPQFKQVGYLPQNLHLKPFHTVKQYMDMLFDNQTIKSRQILIKYYTKIFRLSHLLETKIQELSGGERQKIAMLESISKPIDYLVLDEPFSQLDTEQKLELIEIIRIIVKDKNIPCVLICHDLGDVLKLSQKVLLVQKGKAMFKGDWNQFSHSKNKHVHKLREALIQWRNQTALLIDNLNIL